MTEASWGEGTTSPPIDWRTSAALENVPRGEGDVAEVTSLEGAVRAWQELDPEHRRAARLTTERAVLVDGVATTTWSSDGIAMLAERLSAQT